jgi:pyrimidine-nucleoside phosphorylase
MSAFLMAVVFRGLDGAELDALVEVMLRSGAVLDLSHLPGPVADKHSTGGVGDKVSLALAPLAAEAGLFVPMMAGRGLGHTGGTLDKFESIPGVRTDLSLRHFRALVETEGMAIAGQTEDIAPLDRRLYALRSVTGTVASIPLIVSSILSKKLAEGISSLVLDVKVGRGAFLPTLDQARALAQALVDVGRSRGLKTTAVLTAMDRPLGRTVGNALEVREALDCLRGEGPEDLRTVVLHLTAQMMVAAGQATRISDAEAKLADLLDGGRPLERLQRVVLQQGGDPSVLDRPDRLPRAPVERPVVSPLQGVVVGVDPLRVARTVFALGGGRKTLEDPIAPEVGVSHLASSGDRIAAGDRIAVVHARTPEDAAWAAERLLEAIQIGSQAVPTSLPLILDVR